MENETLWDVTRTNGGFFESRSTRRAAGQRTASYEARCVRATSCGFDTACTRAQRRSAPWTRMRGTSCSPAPSAACQQGPVALTGPSAAVLHGFTVYGHDLETVHLIRLDRGTGRLQAGVNHHESMTDLERLH